MTPLPRSFYLQDTITVARALLGCVLWRRAGRELLGARLVEVEAYLGANDMASHARRGLRSPRNESMYLDGGHAYVYFTYGMHYCMNVVTQEADIAEAVLLRAAEPVRGIEAMRARRAKAKRDVDLMNGPGKLCYAMAIDRELDGERLDGKRLFLTARDIVVDDVDIAVSPRIGIDNSGEAAHWPLRFFLRGNRYVSGGGRGRSPRAPR
jgi:DNA-3-methyladenine glycosylase